MAVEKIELFQKVTITYYFFFNFLDNLFYGQFLLNSGFQAHKITIWKNNLFNYKDFINS